jgi:hypothetical protein
MGRGQAHGADHRWREDAVAGGGIVEHGEIRGLDHRPDPQQPGAARGEIDRTRRHRRQAGIIIRGIRAVSDYEYELQMALMNRRLEPEIETFFMLPAEHYSYLSSRLVRELAQNQGPLDGLVPERVALALGKKYGRNDQ